MKNLSPDQSAQLDGHIFRREILVGLKFLIDSLRVPLKEALEQYSRRYEELRESEKGRFTVSHEEYWKDFYS
jgi:hypothetical protein